MTTIDQLIAEAKTSTRGPGKCLGFVGNDLTGKFGSYPHQYGSAKAAANSLGANLHTSACPSNPHFDFYNFVQKGVNYGHIDIHIPSRGIHLADSSRITVKLNKRGTVGTYPTWGPRLGWSYSPGAGNSILIQNDPPRVSTASVPSAAASGAWAVNLPSAAVQSRIQIALGKRGRYNGPKNGVFGKNSWIGIQTTVSKANGNTYTGPINGIPGRNTVIAIQEYAKAHGGYTGPINGILGPNGWEGFARGLEKGL